MASNMDWNELNTFINDKFSNSDTSIDQSNHHNAFRQQLESYPNDINFIVDLVDRSITCMEEELFTPMPFNFDPSGAIDFSSFVRELLAKRAPVVKTEDIKPDIDLATSRASSPELKPIVDVKSSLNVAPSPSLAGASSSSHKREGEPLRKPKKKLKVIDLTSSSPAPSRAPSPAPRPLAALNRRQQLAQSQLDKLDEEKESLRQTLAQIEHERTRHAQRKIKLGSPVPAEAAQQAVAGPGPASLALAQRNAAARAQNESSAARDDSKVVDTVMADLFEPFKESDEDDSSDEVAAKDEPSDAQVDEALRNVIDKERFDDSATVDEAVKALGMNSQDDLIPNLASRPLAYQLIGVAWMLKQEKSRTRGGILGDEMGLGKTVQMIALMAVNESTDKKKKSTLIVVPAAILTQWQREIHDHTEDDHFSVLVYRADGRKTISTARQVGHHDVVLATYDMLVYEFNEVKAEKRARKEAAKEGRRYVSPTRPPGLLFDVDWYRVVLDEAHRIKNKKIKAEKAVVKLKSVYRWALTGTIIVNKHEDVYPLFEFLRFEPWSDFDYFKAQIAPSQKVTAFELNKRSRKLNTALAKVLLRRKKDSQLDGKPLLTLPPKNVNACEIEFSAEERSIYDKIEAQAKIPFVVGINGNLRENTVDVLPLLMKLLQTCVHPALRTGAYNAERERKLKRKAIASTAQVIGQASTDKLRKVLLDRAIERLEAEQAGDMQAYAGREDCPICFESATDAVGGAVITSCAHVFCKPCLEQIVSSESGGPAQHDSASGERSCPVCRGPISPEEVFALAAFEPHYDEIREARPDLVLSVDTSLLPLNDFVVSDGEDESEEDSVDEEVELVGDVDQQRVTRNRGRELIGPKPPKRRNHQVIYDSDDEEPELPERALSKKEEAKEKARLKRVTDAEERWWRSRQPPSTKMRKCLAEVKRVDEESPDDKIIIISQWTSALDMVAAYFARNGYEFGRFQGDMSNGARDRSLQEFMSESTHKIMLLSLRCGGVGLNLTRANRVILLEPEYSPAIEVQAFDRVHRIGQKKEVSVLRLITKDTIEVRMENLQAIKRHISNGSLEENFAEVFTADLLTTLFGFKVKGRRRSKPKD